MKLIGGVLADMFGLLPFVAVLLLSLFGYLITKRGRTELVDSPWFWVFVFSSVGLIGVWAISKKYDDREKRLETRYEARQRIAERRAQQADAPRKRPREEETAELQSGYDAKRQVPLRFLAGGLLVIALGSGIMLWRGAVKSNRQAPGRPES